MGLIPFLVPQLEVNVSPESESTGDANGGRWSTSVATFNLAVSSDKTISEITLRLDADVRLRWLSRANVQSSIGVSVRAVSVKDFLMVVHVQRWPTVWAAQRFRRLNRDRSSGIGLPSKTDRDVRFPWIFEFTLTSGICDCTENDQCEVDELHCR